MFTISAIEGFTFPGMMLEPGWTGGRTISASPVRGPEALASGDLGPAPQLAMSILVRMAEVYGAERVVLAINRAVTMGLLSRKRVLEAIAHVDTLRARLPR